MSEMAIGRGGGDASARGAGQEPGLDEVGLVEVLEAVHALAHGDRQSLGPHGPARIFLDDRAQDLAVEPLEAELVYLEAVEAAAHDGAGLFGPSPSTWAKSRIRRRSLLAIRGVPRLDGGEQGGGVLVHVHPEDRRRAMDDRLELAGLVIAEAERYPEAARERRETVPALVVAPTR